MSLAGVARWSDAAWLAEHIAWAEARLAEFGRRRSGGVEQRARPWSTVVRIPTDGGVAWSKANGPGGFHEGPLLAVFAEVGVAGVLLPLAVDAARGWLLLDDGGRTLRDLILADGRKGDADLRRWEQIVGGYAALQRRMEGSAGAMLGAGVPDERLARLPETLARLLDSDAIWSRVDAGDVAAIEAARRRLGDLAPVVAELVEELAAPSIAPTVEHGDVHGNNIVIGEDATARVFDWGDAVVAHPFLSLTGILGSLGHHAGVDPHGADLDRVRDAYLEVWTDVAPRASLARLIPVAMDLGHITKAAAWERAMIGLAPVQMGGHHGTTAAWLADLVPRLETRAGASHGASR